MIKKDLIKIFIDEIHSTPPKKNYETNKIIYNLIDEIWSIDLADMIDYRISNNKGFRYIFVIIDNYRKYLWATTIPSYRINYLPERYNQNLLLPTKLS